ncbi:hypothetical protein M9H77_34150 [Catharanthus roseus]|uniref:Uncharacterized protein n=1 Tax=Catharanthus roseus TaxID=4058 RepID=A0ACB9ZNY7_CATRO|nr:hypothetical protein M9H77_34150 [Catharanthus roseus]
MALAAAASTALLSSTTRASLSPKSSSSNLVFSHSLSIPSSFNGLRKPAFSHFPLSLSLSLSLSLISDAALVGNKAPDFEAEAVFDQEFINVKLSEYLGKKYVSLFFYPLDFTFVCPIGITAFSDRYDEFQKLNTEILGVSTDRKSGVLGDLKYPLISDVTKSISKSYGVLFPHSTLTTNSLAIGRSVDETMRTLQALQYVQENPDEVCPAGWKPGEKSTNPNPNSV